MMKTNNWNRLLAVLDALFAYGRKERSTLKKRGEAYDQKTGEHVVLIEYRVRMKDQSTAPLPNVPLLRELNRLGRLKGSER